jgi:hypothetical protein
MDFLAHLQDWLQSPSRHNWRIAVVTELGNEETIMVYPNLIRTGGRYEHNLPASPQQFAQRMRQEA